MKTCSKCNLPQDKSCFSKRAKAKDGLKSHCKICDRLYNQNCDKEKRNSRKFTSQKLRRELRYLKILQFLKDKKCTHCSETDPVVMEFDHINKNTKIMCVSEMVTLCFSWKKIEAEINKCQILCANCHRRKTAKDFGYYKNRE